MKKLLVLFAFLLTAMNAAAVQAPPTTSYSGCNNAWNDTNQTITLTCVSDDAYAACDSNSPQYSLDGSWQAYSAPFALSTDGNHSIGFYSKDIWGNQEATNTRYCAIDKSAPSVPGGLSASASGRNVSISWNSASDSTSGIREYILNRGDTAIYSGSSTSYSDNALSDGTYSYKIKSRDNAGNDSGFSSEVSVTIGGSISSPPPSSGGAPPSGFSLDLKIIAPDFARAETVSFEIRSNTSNDMQGYNLKIKLPGKSLETIASDSGFVGKSVRVNYSFKSGDDGNVLVEAVAWNGQTRSDARKYILVDTKNPNIELVSPKPSALVSKTFELRASSTDANAGVKQVAFYYRRGTSGEWLPIGVGAKLDKNFWVMNWNTASLADAANYQFKAVSTDFAGNTAEKIIDITVSNIASLVTGIKGTATIESEAVFSGSAADVNRMLNAVLKADFAAESSRLFADSNVSRILKIIKIVDGNNVTYKASVFVSFRNNSKENVSLQLVEIIPKELAGSADAIESGTAFVALEKDPIIAWNLENIRAGKAIEITYSLKSQMTKEAAMKLIDENVMEKFFAPPILSLASKQLGRSDFLVSFSTTTTGFLGLANSTWLAIIVGIIVAALIASALYFARTGVFSRSDRGFSGARADDWSFKEPFHKSITQKISSGLGEFIGYKGTLGKKWVFKKEQTKPLGEQKSNFREFFKLRDFTILKKTEGKKPEGKGKWASKIDNSDI